MKEYCESGIKWLAAGEKDDPQYAGGGGGGSEIGVELRRSLGAILCEHVKELDSNQLDHLGRLLGDALSFVRTEHEKKHATLKRAWEVPEGFLCKWEGVAASYFAHSWWDHAERHVGLDTGWVSWVSHPYSLSSDSMKDLIRLEELGHRVEVTGGSWYFPGRTLFVSVSAKKIEQGKKKEVFLG